jgi:outer membrane protein assembly factor BamA
MKCFRDLLMIYIGAGIMCVLASSAMGQSDVFKFDIKVCKQPKKDRDAILNATEGSQHTVRRIEFYGNTYTRDRILRDQLVFKEGDIFDRKDLKKSLKRISQMKTFGLLTMDNVKVLLDLGQKDVDFIFCVTEIQ